MGVVDVLWVVASQVVVEHFQVYLEESRGSVPVTKGQVTLERVLPLLQWDLFFGVIILKKNRGLVVSLVIFLIQNLIGFVAIVLPYLTEDLPAVLL